MAKHRRRGKRSEAFSRGLFQKVAAIKWVAIVAALLATVVSLEEFAYAAFGATAQAEITSIRSVTRRELENGPSNLGRGRRTRQVVREYVIHTYKFRDRNGNARTGEFEIEGSTHTGPTVTVEYIPGLMESRLQSRGRLAGVIAVCIAAMVTVGALCLFMRFGGGRRQH